MASRAGSRVRFFPEHEEIVPASYPPTATQVFFRTTNNMRNRIYIAIAAGVIYGLLLRVGFEKKSFGAFFQIVSTTFLVVAPFSLGAISVLMAAGGKPISLGNQIVIALTAMLLFLVAMFICFLEGLICLVLVAPVFLFASIIGGILAGWVNNRFRVSKASLSSFAFLPLLLGPIEANLPPTTSEQTVITRIAILAPPAVVFDQILSAKNIRPDELGFSFVHLIGLPKPLQASMDGTGVGAIRTSRWEKEVSFQERITVWDKPKALHYNFNIPAGAIPKNALDRHVEMGGEYFTVLDGGYDLVETNSGTELRLTTRFLNKSQLKLYGDLWGRMVLEDFHQSILGLMKRRAEETEKLHELKG